MHKVYRVFAVTVLATVLSACNMGGKSSQTVVKVSGDSGSNTSGVCREGVVKGRVHPDLPQDMLPVFSGTGVEVTGGGCTRQPSGGYIVDTVLSLSPDRYDEVVKYYRDVLIKLHGDPIAEIETAKGEQWGARVSRAWHNDVINYSVMVNKSKSGNLEVDLVAHYPAK